MPRCKKMRKRDFAWHRSPACEFTTQTRSLCHNRCKPFGVSGLAFRLLTEDPVNCFSEFAVRTSIGRTGPAISASRSSTSIFNRSAAGLDFFDGYFQFADFVSQGFRDFLFIHNLRSRWMFIRGAGDWDLTWRPIPAAHRSSADGRFAEGRPAVRESGPVFGSIPPHRQPDSDL